MPGCFNWVMGKTNESMIIVNYKQIFSFVMLCILIFWVGRTFAQDRYTVLEYAAETKIRKPEEAVEIANSILNQSNPLLDCKVYLLLADTYMLLEAYDKAIDAIQSIYRLSCKKEALDYFYIKLLEAKIYQKLEIETHRLQALAEITGLLKESEQKSEYEFMLWSIQLLDLTDDSSEFTNLKIDLFNFNPDVYLQDVSMRAYIFTKYLKLLRVNPTEENQQKLATYIEKHDIDEEKWFFAKIAHEQADALIHLEQNAEAVDLLNQAIEFLDYTAQVPYTKSAMVNQLLANSTYIQDKDLVFYYRDLNSTLGTQIQKIETTAINNIYRYKIENNKIQIEKKSETYDSIKKALWGVSVFVFVIMMSWWLRIKRHERYNNEIFQYLSHLNTEDKNISKEDNIEDLTQSIAKSSKLSDTVVSEIISGLKQFEEDGGYLDNSVSLSSVSARLGVNTKYLSEVLNTHLEESFNIYINRLRVEYMVNKLKDEPKYLKYKISYLAEVAGYTSHSSFSTAFKNVTGVSPTKFISYLNKEL